MQTSGTFKGLSDGVRKTIRGANPPTAKPAMPAMPKAKMPPMPKGMMGTPESKMPMHRRGGFARHARGK